VDKVPLTVIHVIETLATGGAERLLVTVLPELQRQGMRAEVAVLRPPFDLQFDLEHVGIKVHVLSKRKKWALLSSCRDLADLAKEREADVLHAHLYFPIMITALARVLRLFRGVTHASFHNLAYGGANRRTWKLAIKQKLAQVLVSRGIDQPQAVSRASADHYAMAYVLDSVEVLHNAIDISVLEAIEPAPGEAIVLPGRLVHEKGHFDLIKALGMLGMPCPPVIFAGDGPLRMELEEQITANQLPISITGQLDYPDMLAIIAGARLVVIPSRYEGFGLTALEALSLGRAVVISTAGGLLEAVGNLGRQVPPADPDALAQAVTAALGDQEWLESQQAAGPARALLFSVKLVAERQIKLYGQTLRNQAT